MKKPRDPNETVKRFFPFYPAMWLTSRKLRFCSSSARGILADLMAMCWETGGKLEESIDILAASVRETPRKTHALLEELAKWERITLDTDGNLVKITVPHLVGIYEEAVQMIEAKRTAGSKGAEIRYSTPIADPSQTHSTPIAITLPDLTVPDPTLPEKKKPKKEPVRFPFGGDTEAEQALETWLTHKKERHESYKPTGLEGLYRNIADMGRDRFIAAVALSTASNYAGLVDRATPSNGPARTPQKSPSNAAHGADPHRFDHLIERSPNNG